MTAAEQSEEAAGRPIPQNIRAEMALLGACLAIPGAFGDARPYLNDGDFYRPGHEEVWRAICTLVDAGKDAPILRVHHELTKTGRLEKAGGAAYLHTLVESAGSAAPGWCAQRIHEAAQARQLIRLGQRLQQVGEEQFNDNDEMLSKAAALLVTGEVLVDEQLGAGPLNDLVGFDELWRKAPSTEVQWMVDELLVRGDVWFILGGEGGGKSYLSRQFVLCLAAGIDPLRPHKRVDPLRTMLIDLENDEDMLAYETRKIGEQIARITPLNHGRAKLWHHPKGLNLRERKDQVLFERHVSEAQPDFVAIGSLYKMMRRGRDDWDTAAEEIRDFLDTMRNRYHFALMVEHHMRKGQAGTAREATPYGAITWQQWPSMGHALERVGDNAWALTAYRGNRLSRELPVGMHRSGALPWTPIWDETELQATSWQKPGRAKKADARLGSWPH